MAYLASSFWTSPGGILLLGVAAAALVGIAGWALKRWGLPSAERRLADRRARRTAPQDVVQLTSYLTHVRDFVMPMVWRAHDSPGELREHIRRDVLEAIRGVVSTEPGEQLKVVWFRPNPEHTRLIMYEQVGHTPEGQQAMSLPIGSGAAGRAFARDETIYESDIATSQVFDPIPVGSERGSIACVPIKRGTEITGVLSVLSTSKDAFRFPELLYFEALASAIGAIEVVEKNPSD
jgi:hypothetical protein